jgi:hypothetical protein
MNRLRLFTVFLVIAPTVVFAQDSQTRTAAAGPQLDRFHDFVHVAVLSPTPYALPFAGGVLDQLSNMPDEWSGGAGFGKRYLARQGGGLASDAIGHSVAAVIHHRVRYDPCSCRGFARVKHAMGRAFVSAREDGGRAPNYSLWIAKFSAAGLANTWYPASYTSSDIVREGSVGIVVSGGLNILNEFSPELMKLIPFR